jgi:osmotically inducible lipoprotein OsmB
MESVMLKRVAVFVVALPLLAGCDHMSQQQQRALSGGAIGAGAGAVAGAIVGGPVLGLALIGGAAGAATGALTTPSHTDVGRPSSR